MTLAQIKSLPIHSDPDILGGATVFAGTRVPVRTVFDYLADGCTIDEFLENFPTVDRASAISVVEAGGESLLELTRSR